MHTLAAPAVAPVVHGALPQTGAPTSLIVLAVLGLLILTGGVVALLSSRR